MLSYCLSSTGTVLPFGPQPARLPGSPRIWELFSGERTRAAVERAVGACWVRRRPQAIPVHSGLLRIVPCRMAAWSHEADFAPVQHELTERELDVLRLYCVEDLPPKRIAEKLGIAEATVYRHRNNAMAKLGFHNLGRAALWLREHGLI